MVNEKTKQQKHVCYEVFQDFSEFADKSGYTVRQSHIDLPNKFDHITLLFTVGTNPIEVLQALKSLEDRIQSEIVKGYEYRISGKYTEPTEDPKGNS